MSHAPRAWQQSKTIMSTNKDSGPNGGAPPESAGPRGALALATGSTAVVRTRVHMCLCVAGALRWKDSRLAGLFTKDDGSECTGREAREYLKLQDYQGRRVIPIGDCDNFDYNTGCRGHPEQ